MSAQACLSGGTVMGQLLQIKRPQKALPLSQHAMLPGAHRNHRAAAVKACGKPGWASKGLQGQMRGLGLRERLSSRAPAKKEMFARASGDRAEKGVSLDAENAGLANAATVVESPLSPQTSSLVLCDRAVEANPIAAAMADEEYSSEGEMMREECGVVGVFGDTEASRICYLGLHALQHRGQEGAGIVSSNNNQLTSITGMGLVADVFNQQKLTVLEGSSAIGHVRYATAGGSNLKNVQVRGVGLFSLGKNGSFLCCEASTFVREIVLVWAMICQCITKSVQIDRSVQFCDRTGNSCLPCPALPWCWHHEKCNYHHAVCSLFFSSFPLFLERRPTGSDFG